VTSAVAVSAPVEAERTALLRWLQFQRDSVVAVVADLDPGLAETSVDPSGWTPAGLVWHLGDAEWFWAQSVLAGSTSPDPRPKPPGPSLADAVARYRRLCVMTDEVVAALALDARPPGLDEPGLPTELDDVREVVLHLIEETARHAGHLDIARELLDGRTGLGPR